MLIKSRKFLLKKLVSRMLGLNFPTKNKILIVTFQACLLFLKLRESLLMGWSSISIQQSSIKRVYHRILSKPFSSWLEECMLQPTMLFSFLISLGLAKMPSMSTLMCSTPNKMLRQPLISWMKLLVDWLRNMEIELACLWWQQAILREALIRSFSVHAM